MDKMERARFRDPQAARMTFAELVRDHYLPTYAHAARNTVKNLRSHLGDGTGEAKRSGAKNKRAARCQLLHVFGDLELAAALGISAAAIMWLALMLAGVDPDVRNPAVIAVGALGLAASVAVAGRGREHTHLSEATGVFFLILAALAGVVALNRTMAKPYISDEGSLIAVP
jgi:hypothetical protein